MSDQDSRVPSALHESLHQAARDWDPAKHVADDRAAADVLRAMSNEWVERGERSGYTEEQASALFRAEAALRWNADELERKWCSS